MLSKASPQALWGTYNIYKQKLLEIYIFVIFIFYRLLPHLHSVEWRISFLCHPFWNFFVCSFDVFVHCSLMSFRIHLPNENDIRMAQGNSISQAKTQDQRTSRILLPTRKSVMKIREFTTCKRKEWVILWIP